MSEDINKPVLGTPPKVSIGMPVFNGEPFIREALDSLLAQTFIDFELIISDNGSTDGTEVICLEYAMKYSQIRYVLQTENRGAEFNFQFVLNEARGEYFMWAAHDDVWHPEFLMSCVQNLEKHQDCDLAFCTYGLCDVSGEIVQVMPDYTRFVNKWRLLTVCRFIIEPEFMAKVSLIHGLFRRDTCKTIYNIRPLDKELWGCDNHFILALLSRRNIAIDTKTLFYKRDKLGSDELKKYYKAAFRHPYRHMGVPANKWLNYLNGQLSAVRGTHFYLVGLLVGFARIVVRIVNILPVALDWSRRRVFNSSKRQET